MHVQHGEVYSRKISINVGTPQGSVLATILFRLHLHFLPKMFMQFKTHKLKSCSTQPLWGYNVELTYLLQLNYANIKYIK